MARRAHDGLIYFAGAPPQLQLSGQRSGRAWRGQAAALKASSDDEELSRLEAKLESGSHFVRGRLLRSRPMGCFLRLSGGREAFLPVEHMLPRTEANTNAVRAAAEKAATKGGLRVREIGGGRVSMLSPNEEAMRGKERLELGRFTC